MFIRIKVFNSKFNTYSLFSTSWQQCYKYWSLFQILQAATDENKETNGVSKNSYYIIQEILPFSFSAAYSVIEE